MTITLAPEAPERPSGQPAAPLLPAARLDIVVPVHNEQTVLQDSIRRLHAFLSHEMPYAWRIVIADNASTSPSSPPRSLTCVACCAWSSPGADGCRA